MAALWYNRGGRTPRPSPRTRHDHDSTRPWYQPYRITGSWCNRHGRTLLIVHLPRHGHTAVLFLAPSLAVRRLLGATTLGILHTHRHPVHHGQGSTVLCSRPCQMMPARCNHPGQISNSTSVSMLAVSCSLRPRGLV